MTMTEPISKIKFAAGYLVADLPYDLYYPYSNNTIYKSLPNPLEKYVEIKTYNGRNIHDSIVTERGSILIPLHSDVEMLTQHFLHLIKEEDLEDGTENLEILKLDMAEYVRLGIFIPLDENGILAHKYGIL